MSAMTDYAYCLGRELGRDFIHLASDDGSDAYEWVALETLDRHLDRDEEAAAHFAETDGTAAEEAVMNAYIDGWQSLLDEQAT